MVNRPGLSIGLLHEIDFPGAAVRLGSGTLLGEQALRSPSVDGESLAGDPTGGVACQKQDSRSDILGSAEPLGVQPVYEALLAVGTVALPLPLASGIGEYEARRDRVDRDAARTEFPGQLLGQADQRMLGGGIGLDAGPARAKPCARCNEDDPTPASFDHFGPHGLSEPKGGVHIGGKDCTPVLFRDFRNGPSDLSAHTAGGTCQNIDRSMCSFDFLDTGRHGFLVAEVDRAATGADLCRRCLDAI